MLSYLDMFLLNIYLYPQQMQFGLPRLICCRNSLNLICLLIMWSILSLTQYTIFKTNIIEYITTYKVSLTLTLIRFFSFLGEKKTL